MLQLCIETASKTLYHTGLIYVHLCVGMRTQTHTLLNRCATPLSYFIHLALKSYENGAQQELCQGNKWRYVHVFVVLS